MTSNNSVKDLERQIYEIREELSSLFSQNKMGQYEKVRAEKLNPFLEKYKNLTGKVFIPNTTYQEERENPSSTQTEEKKIIPQRTKKVKNNITGAPAPKLEWYGDKWNNKGTYDPDKRLNGYYFYQLPVPIIDYIFSTLDGKNGTLLKIMVVLMGTDRGFGISEKWICDRIGIKSRDSAKSYYRARNELHKMGWIEYDSEKHKIYICYDFLWQEAFAAEDERMPVLEWRKDESRG